MADRASPRFFSLSAATAPVLRCCEVRLRTSPHFAARPLGLRYSGLHPDPDHPSIVFRSANAGPFDSWGCSVAYRTFSL